MVNPILPDLDSLSCCGYCDNLLHTQVCVEFKENWTITIRFGRSRSYRRTVFFLNINKKFTKR